MNEDRRPVSDETGDTGAWGMTALAILWVLFVLAAGATAHSVVVTFF